MKPIYKFKCNVILALMAIQFICSTSYGQSNLTNQNTGSNNALFTVVPNSSASVGGIDFFSGAISSLARTYQLIIAGSELTSLVNTQLSSIAFRLPTQTPNPFPTSAFTIPNYDIYLAQSVAPQNRSLTFSSNIIGAKTLVRSGPLTIPASTFSSGGSPNSFGFQIDFSSNWLYTGGNLVIEIRHSGYTASVVSFAMEAIPAAGAGYGTLFTGCFGLAYNATSGSQANFVVVKINNQNVLNTSDLDKTSFSLYPNPTNEVLNINSEVKMNSITIYNLVGQVVLEKKLNAQFESVSISNLPEGVYNVKVVTDLDTKTKKIFKVL